MSLSQLIIGLNWLAEGDLAIKWKRFTTNKAALVLCSFYVMHLLGLIYTTDFTYGMEDIRKKVPLLIMPFLFCTSNPINEKGKRIILFCFIGTVTVVTFIGLYLVYKHAFIDIHKISPFVSPIRLALMIVLSVFLLFGYVFSTSWKPSSLLVLAWSLWLMIYLVIMESLTGVVITCIIAAVLLIYYAIKQIKNGKRLHGSLIIGLFVAGFISISAYLNHFHHKYFPEPEKVSVQDKVSVNGHVYDNYLSQNVENGHFVGTYISWGEMRSEWNKKGHIGFDSLDKKGNELKFTLVRYLTSKDLRKDSSGVSQLTAEDIRAIEGGIPNYNFTATSSMEFRLYQAIWEIEDYRRGGNINGHSITQRFEFWRAAVGIVKQHILIGVGTGNVKKAFAEQYDKMHSQLIDKFRLRSHNQYLEIMVGFGLVGLLWMLVSLIYPAIAMKKLYSYAYIIFWIIVVFSMCSEDTLEEQAGVTFYAFFNSFFLFVF